VLLPASSFTTKKEVAHFSEMMGFIDDGTQRKNTPPLPTKKDKRKAKL